MLPPRIGMSSQFTDFSNVVIGQAELLRQLAHRASLIVLARINMARRTGIPEAGALVFEP